MQGGGTRDASESRIAPLPPNAGKGPIARLQTALAARNDDIRALQERLAIEMSRADRSEIDAESRRRDAEEARLLTLELKKMLMEADRRMLDKEDLLDELERKLLRQENEHSKKIAALEKQLTKLQEETQDTPRTLSNDHNAVIVELQNSLTDAAREQARLAQELVAKDDEQTALRMSCEEMIKSAQKSANSSQDQLRDLQLQLESVVNNDEELASIWEYVRNVRDEDCPSQDASLLSYVRQTVEEGRLAVARLMEEKTALTAELEECGFALEEMEEKLMTSDDASEKHLEVLARAEDLQSQLLSREVELWRVRDELTQANQTVDELRLTLDKVLDENQALTSAAEAGFRLEDDENRHSAVKRPVSEDRHPTDSLDSVAGKRLFP
ncbi:hypothetical protein DFJ77DRAFT_83533 [Powellomyces hirtus]|nr:hypothetical protein DFJ77DRAFT_83533 [Powellomyces hirtus]